MNMSNINNMNISNINNNCNMINTNYNIDNNNNINNMNNNGLINNNFNQNNNINILFRKIGMSSPKIINCNKLESIKEVIIKYKNLSGDNTSTKFKFGGVEIVDFSQTIGQLGIKENETIFVIS